MLVVEVTIQGRLQAKAVALSVEQLAGIQEVALTAEKAATSILAIETTMIYIHIMTTMKISMTHIWKISMSELTIRTLVTTTVRATKESHPLKRTPTPILEEEPANSNLKTQENPWYHTIATNYL